MLIRCGLASLVLLLAACKPHDEWYCRNQVEIHCSGGDCRASDPSETSTMTVTFNSAGEFSVCAYSGCWTGDGRIQSFASGFFITRAQAEWNFEPSGTGHAADILIAFDESDRIALVKAGTDGSFAHPFTCELRE